MALIIGATCPPSPNTLQPPQMSSQLQLLLLTFPARRGGYGYMMLSMGVATLLGVIILGTTTWVKQR